MQIKSVKLYNLDLPLVKPYHTALGDLTSFNSVIAIVRTEKKVGIGESTPVLGYSWESPKDVWEYVQHWGKEIVGKQVNDAIEILRPHLLKKPFSVTPLFTAIEGLLEELPAINEDKEFPLVGILNVVHREEIADILNQLLGEGYTTIKVKVGFRVEEDIEKVQRVQSLLGNKGKIRIDANQGYTFEDALKFVREIDPSNIELFEQPFHENDWETMRHFAPLSSLPLMLDESIYQEEDVQCAYEFGCTQFIKLKLMKTGSILRLQQLSTLVHQRGFGLVLGNGVASDISCYQETQIALQLGVKTAGEMNGFLKLRRPLLPNYIFFAQGKVFLKPASSLVPDQRLLSKYSKNELRWER